MLVIITHAHIIRGLWRHKSAFKKMAVCWILLRLLTEILYLLLYIDVRVTASDLVSALRRLLIQSRSQESLQLDTKQAW